MTKPWMRLVAGGLLLGCSGCVVAPPPAPPPTCQQFTQPITVDGKTVTGYGLQCLQADGSWRVVMPPSATPPQVQSAPAPVGAYPVPYGYYYPYPAYDYYPWMIGPEVGVGGVWIGGGGGWDGGRGWGGGGFHDWHR